MKVGADRKKLIVLGVLLAVAAGILYSNLSSSPEVTAPRPVAVSSQPGGEPAPGPASINETKPAAKRRTASSGSVVEFKPRQMSASDKDRPDPLTVDPTLRLDLLAKVQAVEMAETSRNVFQFGTAPPPPKPVELPKNVPKIAINQTPPAPPARPTGPPPPPPPPPITFKYYGYKVSKSSGRKEAFLLDGDDIIIAAESDLVKRGRYRVVRINVGSITIEDTQFKNTQTLPIVEEAAA